MAIHETRMKYVNVLLVAAAASVGFSVTQTRTEALSFWALPWALSLLMWGLSFICGCNYIFKRSVLFSINLKAVQVKSGKDPQIGNDKKRIEGMLKFLEDDETLGYKATDSKIARSMRWQFKLFLFGSGLYIVWHVIEMWRRIPENMCLWV